MARGFAAIANGGDLLRPYIVKRVTDDNGTVRYAATPHLERRVMSKRTAETVTELLVGVTEHGTGKQARIDGFRVAGKTGTAQKVDPGTGRYSARDRMSSFIGFVPAENPALVIVAVLDSPRTATYGGVVAAPVFKAVAEYGLARRGILPSAEPAVEPAAGAAGAAPRRGAWSRKRRPRKWRRRSPPPAACRASSACRCATPWCAPRPTAGRCASRAPATCPSRRRYPARWRPTAR